MRTSTRTDPDRARSLVAPLALGASATIAVGALLALAVAAAAQAPSARDRMLVTTDWLAAHLDDPELVLLHVGEKAEYDAGHIRGARYITLRDIDGSTAERKPLELPAMEDLLGRLEGFGISDDSRIVVYYGDDWLSPATRVVFTLDYAGLGDRTALLDGGMQQWKREGRPVTADVPAVAAGSLSPRQGRDIVVEADYLRANLESPGVAVVDARAAVFYDGVREGMGGRAGHLPGAGSFPFTEVFDESLKLASAEQLAALFERAGVKPGDRVIAYCHIGQQATAVVFAARSLGYDVRLYDGSFVDWASDPDNPVELPTRKERP